MTNAIEIRKCQGIDTEAVMAFIDNHWRKNHLLAVSEAIFTWQYGNEDGSLNFFAAFKGKDIIGILGYIPTRRYDNTLSNSNYVWLALWKIKKDNDISGLGLRMLGELSKAEPNVGLAVSGINPDHLPMYKALGYTTGRLNQFYAVHPDKPQRLIITPQGYKHPTPNEIGIGFREIHQEEVLQLRPEQLSSKYMPFKPPKYYYQRYCLHPFYDYRIFILEGPENKIGVIVIRVASHNEHCAVRIVDYSGDLVLLSGIGALSRFLLEDVDAEYIDFWQHGISDQVIEKSGLTLLNPDGPVQVPSYFEPFSNVNVQILCAYKFENSPPVVLFKGDGDQDRPNQLTGTQSTDSTC